MNPDTEADWYGPAPGTWLPKTVLDGAPLERIRLPDNKGRVRTRIYYDALVDVCGRQAQGPTIAQLLTNMRPQALPMVTSAEEQRHLYGVLCFSVPDLATKTPQANFSPPRLSSRV